jgi:hypothetical protein
LRWRITEVDTAVGITPFVHLGIRQCCQKQ